MVGRTSLRSGEERGGWPWARSPVPEVAPGSGCVDVALKAVVLRDAWAQLGSGAREYEPMSRGGLPTDRTRRTLFTRVFDESTKSELRRAEISDAVAAVVMRQIGEVRDRLERTALWHQALRDAYYRLPKAERFIKDPVEGLFAPAWDEAEHALPDGPGAADAVIARMREGAPGFSPIEVDRLLADPEVRAEFERLLDGVWADAHEPDAHEPDAPTDAERRGLTRELERFCADLVPTRGGFSDDVEEAWTRLAGDPTVMRWTTPARLGLATADPVRKPELIGGGEESGPLGLAVSAYRPLDDSLRGRLMKVLKNPPFAFDRTPSAREGLERAVTVSARPLGLGSASAAAALVVGAFAYAGVTLDRQGRSGRLPAGAIAYLAACWRNAQAVSAQVERSGAAGFVHAQDYIEDPHEYLIGRLWVRLSRTDYDGHDLASPSELWWHLTKALQSSANHVSELAARISREGLGFVSTDDESHIETEFVGSTDGMAAPAAPDDRAARDPSGTDAGTDVGGDAGTRSGFGEVLRHALGRVGSARVDEVIAAMAGLVVDAQAEDELPDVWESWVLGAAAARVAQRAARQGPFDVARAGAVRAAEIARLPTYAQAREQVRARRIAASRRRSVNETQEEG